MHEITLFNPGVLRESFIATKERLANDSTKRANAKLFAQTYGHMQGGEDYPAAIGYEGELVGLKRQVEPGQRPDTFRLLLGHWASANTIELPFSSNASYAQEWTSAKTPGRNIEIIGHFTPSPAKEWFHSRRLAVYSPEAVQKMQKTFGDTRILQPHTPVGRVGTRPLLPLAEILNRVG